MKEKARQEELRVCGINSVMEALKAGAARRVYLRDELGRRKDIAKLARSRDVEIVRADVDVQGVAADVVIKYFKFDDLLTGEGFVLYADGVEDPRNLGALVRSAVFFGCSGVAIPRRRAVRVTDTVVRTSAGAIFHTKVAFATPSHLKKAKKKGYGVFAAELDGVDLRRANLYTPSVLVIGGEDRGVSRPVKNACDEVVRIPGGSEVSRVNSLNLSVAAGILMYCLVYGRSH